MLYRLAKAVKKVKESNLKPLTKETKKQYKEGKKEGCRKSWMRRINK